MNTPDRKKTAKQYLKRGDLDLIAKNLNLSHGTVSNWVNEKADNARVEAVFNKLVEKRKAELEKSLNEI